jgi:hypothetical protein
MYHHQRALSVARKDTSAMGRFLATIDSYGRNNVYLTCLYLATYIPSVCVAVPGPVTVQDVLLQNPSIKICTAFVQDARPDIGRLIFLLILLTPVPSSLSVVAVHRPRPVHSTSASYLPTIAPKAPSSQISLQHDIVCQNRKRNISCMYIYIC